MLCATILQTLFRQNASRGNLIRQSLTTSNYQAKIIVLKSIMNMQLIVFPYINYQYLYL